MIDGTYNVTVRTPLGARKGVVELKDDGGTLVAKVNVKGRSQTAVGTVDGTMFAFSGTMKTPVGLLDYHIGGWVDGDDITAVCATSKGKFSVNGKRV
ncbi:hypothetical protein JS533_000990 [Bifidobacterium amazonense]|uniref:Uncharacterized protein n=1 Tax=Bifidobacterium amazonense TaxID=2809027 RepID=A0ABS9VSD1_9BIFI|nr:hypothetical protein [Bifidobacterium amazonense]MCH9274866.1 hypothetical protein [Bifidobacterium amazonense]